MRFAVLIGLVAPLAAPVAAPSPQVAPGVRAELVRLDAVVTDAHGKLVTDLSREDFEVLEDGKPQRIAQFVVAVHRRGAAPAGTAAASVPSPDTVVAEPAAGASEAGRQIVLLVDDLHVARGNLDYVKAALKRAVDEVVAPEDNVALITTAAPGVVQQPTRDRAVLKQAIDRLVLRQPVVPPARGSRMTPAQAEMILSGDSVALQLATRMLIAEPGSIYEGPSPQVAVEAASGSGGTVAALTGPDAKERAAAKEAERQARGILDEALRFSAASLNMVEGVLRGLSVLPGRKLCLLVSDGFLVGKGTSAERTYDLQAIIDAATRSGAVVYALDSQGLMPTGGDASVVGASVPPGLQTPVDRRSEQLFRETLRTVAETTGGFLIHGTNDLAGGLRRMIEDNDAYYLLAYEPANTRHDGRFRRIELRLPAHRDYTVRTRKGYFALDDRKAGKPGPAVAGPSAPTGPAAVSAPAAGAIEEADARAALSAPIPAGGIPVQLVADYVELPPAGPQGVIRAQVDLGRLRWQDAEGRRQATVELVGGVYDAEGHAVGPPFGRIAPLDLGPAEYKRAAEAGLQYQQSLALRPGRYQVRLVARELKLAQSGGAATWLEIPDLADRKLAMSSVFLSSSPTAAAGAGGAVGGNDAPRDVSARRRFQRGESLYFQIYVYNPAADEKGSRDVVLQAQVWSGGSAIAASKPQPVAFRTRDGVPLPETNEIGLQGLGPGHYDLRVVVVDRKANATVFRKVDFTVE